jgi:hypothetical protein
MKLSDYFAHAKGVGVLATADAGGKVNAAMYGRPHFLDAGDDRTVAFIMSDRLSHANLQTNPHAAYLFIEEGEDYPGKRLTLLKIKEETDAQKIRSLRRRPLPAGCDEGEMRFLVHFRVDSVRPLVGAEDTGHAPG